MHESVMNFAARARQSIVARDGNLDAFRTVIEVGAYDVNGSVRPIFTSSLAQTYVATDMRDGPGVDRVVDARQLHLAFGRGCADLLVSCEMLEHADQWRGALWSMKETVAPGGRMLLTARSHGFPLHDYPADYWRFELDDMRRIFADWYIEMLETDTQAPGVFVLARKPRIIEAPVRLSAIEVRSMHS